MPTPPLDPDHNRPVSHEPPAAHAGLRDRRTRIIALVVVALALWAVVAAALGFATTM